MVKILICMPIFFMAILVCVIICLGISKAANEILETLEETKYYIHKEKR